MGPWWAVSTLRLGHGDTLLGRALLTMKQVLPRSRDRAPVSRISRRIVDCGLLRPIRGCRSLKPLGYAMLTAALPLWQGSGPFGGPCPPYDAGIGKGVGWALPTQGAAAAKRKPPAGWGRPAREEKDRGICDGCGALPHTGPGNGYVLVPILRAVINCDFLHRLALWERVGVRV